MNPDIIVLELSLNKLTDSIDEYLSECIDENGNMQIPHKKALMKIRACLPKTCKNTLIKEK